MSKNWITAPRERNWRKRRDIGERMSPELASAYAELHPKDDWTNAYREHRCFPGCGHAAGGTPKR